MWLQFYSVFFFLVLTSLEGVFSNQVKKVFGYLGDSLIILNENTSVINQDVMNLFKGHGKGLSFTREPPEKNALQFLDLNLQFLRRHTC